MEARIETSSGFIIAIGMNKNCCVLQMPPITQENGWLEDESEYFSEGEYNLDPGVYECDLRLDIDISYEGGNNNTSYFDNFKQVYCLPERI